MKIIGLVTATLLASACAGNADLAGSHKTVELGKVSVGALIKDGTLPMRSPSNRTNSAHQRVAARNFCSLGGGLWCVLTTSGANAINGYYGDTSISAGDVTTGEIDVNDMSDYCTDDEYGGSGGGACQVSSES
jgi:hypothetical protein